MVTLKEIEKVQKKDDDPIVTIIHRKVSKRISWIAIKLGIGANLVSFISLLFGLAGAYFFSVGNHFSVIIGAFLIHFGLAFDCADGEIARLNKINKKYGGWLDSMLDRVIDSSIIIGITIGILRNNFSLSVILLGMYCLMSTNIMAYATMCSNVYFGKVVKHKSSCSRGSLIKKIEKILKIKLNPKLLYFSIDMQKTLFMIGAIFNRMDLALWVFALISTPYWLIRFYIYKDL